MMMSLLAGTAVALHHWSAPVESAAAGDPHAGHVIPRVVPVAVTTAAPLPRTGWTATADDAAAAAPNVLDGDVTTFWRTTASALPHYLTIDHTIGSRSAA